MLVAVVAAVAVVQGAGRVGRLHDALSAGGITASLGLIALQAGWVPTMLVWALAWLAGPGFTVGTGSLFSPDVVIADTVPAMPILGLLPDAPLGAAGVYLPMVITIAAMGAAMVIVQRRQRDPLACCVGLDADALGLDGLQVRCPVHFRCHECLHPD